MQKEADQDGLDILQEHNTAGNADAKADELADQADAQEKDCDAGGQPVHQKLLEKTLGANPRAKRLQIICKTKEIGVEIVHDCDAPDLPVREAGTSGFCAGAEPDFNFAQVITRIQ